MDILDQASYISIIEQSLRQLGITQIPNTSLESYKIGLMDFSKSYDGGYQEELKEPTPPPYTPPKTK